MRKYIDFNPQGSREPRLLVHLHLPLLSQISIHKALASLDDSTSDTNVTDNISIHKALASLDQSRGMIDVDDGISIHKALASLDGFRPSIFAVRKNFNPQGSREPRRQKVACLKVNLHFNPQGSREPRPRGSLRPCRLHSYFNPQGSREPRLIIRDIPGNSIIFQSTRLSRASTAKLSKPAPHPP